MNNIDNLRRVLDQANGEDTKTGLESWFVYNRLTRRIAEQHGFSLEIGAAVFSALSPNNDYLGNLRDTNRVLAAARAGKTVDDFKVSTYHQNKHKAWAIAQGADPLDLLVFPKTRNFYLNIVDPLDPLPITVDGHVYNVWHNRRISLKGAAMRFKPAQYDEIAEAIRILASEMRIIGNQVQGIIWHTWKRLHWILHSDQLEMWDPAAIHAGLGFEMVRRERVALSACSVSVNHSTAELPARCS